MDTCAFTLARCCVLLPALALFGSACFSLYTAVGPRHPSNILLGVGLPAVTGIGALAWLALLGRQMEGRLGFPSVAVMKQICLQTGFGHALGVVAVLSLALVALALRRGSWSGVRVVLSAVLLVHLAFVGHAAAAPGLAGWLREGVMAIHLLAAGLWLGGLPPLARAIRRQGPEAVQVLHRFGLIGLICVCAVLATGLGMSLFILSTTGGRLGHSYLTVFLAKLALVAALLAIAANNRFRLTPQTARDRDRALVALRRSIFQEQALGLSVIVAVSLLGQLDPSM